MKVRHTLICFFVLTLQAGNIFITAGHRILKPIEGGRVTVACSFTSSGDRKFFCKEECKEEIFIETTDDQAENGRYRIEYTKTFFLSYPVLYVSITQLSKADSGRYRCGLGTPLFPDSHEEFEIIVRDAPTTSKSNWTLRPSPASVPSASTPTTTQALSSSSGSFTFSSASPKTTKQSEQRQSETATTSTDPAPTTSKPNWTLRPSSTSVPSMSTPKTTQSLSSSSRSFTTSSAPPKTTKQQQKTESATSPTDPAPTTLRPSSASVPSTSTPKTTRSLSSSSRSFTTSSAPPKTTKQLRQQKSERATSLADPGKLLYVCLLLVLMVFLSSLAVMLFCRKRANKPEEGHLNHQASVPEAYRVREDIREDRQSRSPPMEMSSVYTHAKYTKLSGVETNVDHCVADLN